MKTLYGILQRRHSSLLSSLRAISLLNRPRTRNLGTKFLFLARWELLRRLPCLPSTPVYILCPASVSIFTALSPFPSSPILPPTRPHILYLFLTSLVPTSRPTDHEALVNLRGPHVRKALKRRGKGRELPITPRRESFLELLGPKAI